MELSLSGGEVAAKRKRSSSDGEEVEEEKDHISALPDDILLQFLLRLDTAAAGRTSVLSKRWRRVWKLLPELCFRRDTTDLDRVRAALSTHDADLNNLDVEALHSTPESVAACLRVAAPRLSGRLAFLVLRDPERNADEGEEEQQENGAFELPCFDRATFLFLHLGSVGLALPAAGVFARLTTLSLSSVRFHGSCELGDAVSSPRSPVLEKLIVYNARGLLNLAIHSESLTQLGLTDVRGLRQLTVVAPSLTGLTFRGGSAHCELVADISAPQLEELSWDHERCVPFREMTQLQKLSSADFHVYSQWPTHNRNVARLLKQIRSTTKLCMVLRYPRDIRNPQYLMKEIVVLPRFTALDLTIIASGHTFGASVFHLLKMCIGLKELKLLVRHGMEARIKWACPPFCICDKPSNWKTEELTLNCLQTVEIYGIKGFHHEVTFLKRLLNWATILETMSITFDRFVSKDKAKKFCQTISSFSRTETRMEFYVKYGVGMAPRYLITPDEDHDV